MQLTPEQQAFVDAMENETKGIRLDAVAGSGKTTTLLEAAKRIPSSQKTCALAFNKKMQEVLATKFPSHVDCSTFNGLGHRIWGKYRGRVSLKARKMGEITSDVCKERGLGDHWPHIKALAEQIKKSGLILPNYMEKVKYEQVTELTQDELYSLAEHHDLRLSEDIVGAALEVLDRSCAEALNNRIDFDDQIYMSTYFAGDKFWPKYDNILVDESQDLSNMQHDMVARMTHENTRLIIVGDPHQAIYGWRGASSDSMDILTDRFGLKHMPLSVCFRCPPEVVSIAQRIVPQIKPFEGKESGIVERRGTDWKPEDLELGSVVLCRNNAPLVATAFSLLGQGIPAYFSGRDMGAGLKKTVDKIGDGPLGEALINWKKGEIEIHLANQKYDMADMVEDKYESLACIMEACQATNKRELKDGIDYLFRKEYSRDAIELSTIHRSKGKEWNTVYFLNQHLIPGRWVQEAEDEGKACAAWMMAQEHNLKYVGVTRALNKLVFIGKTRREEPNE